MSLTRTLLLALATAGLTAGGCSWITVDAPPPAPPAAGAVDCTQSRIAPVVDTAIATLAAIGALYFVASDDEHRWVGSTVEAGLSAAFALSAWSGYRNTGRCRDVVRSWAAPAGGGAAR